MSREIAESWLGAFQAKDISLLKLADDFVHTSPFGEVHGGDTYLDLIRTNEEAFFSNPIKVVDFVDGGDRFIVRYVVGDMPACDWIYVQDEMISRVFSYYHFGEKPVLWQHSVNGATVSQSHQFFRVNLRPNN